MKHIKIYEEISTSINPELLGLTPDLLTPDLFLRLLEKYAKTQDYNGISHLVGLYNASKLNASNKKYNTEENRDLLKKIGELSIKYPFIETAMDKEKNKYTHSEWEAAKKEARRSEWRVNDFEHIEIDITRFIEEMKPIIYKMIEKYDFDNRSRNSSHLTLAGDMLASIKEILEDYKKGYFNKSK